MRFSFLAFLLLAPPIPAGAADYVSDVLPLMKKHCWDCHSAETEVKGNLALDPDTLQDQIGTYNIIRPGNAEESGFVERLKLDETHADFMPRKGSALPGKEIEAIETWIREGAVVDASKPTEEESKRLKEMAGSGGTPAEGKPVRPFQTWTNREGKTIEARLVELSGEVAKLAMRDGKTYDVPLDSLADESAAKARELAAAQ